MPRSSAAVRGEGGQVKSSMDRIASEGKIYYHSLCGKLSAAWSYATEVAQLATLNCSQPQPLTDDDMRDASPNYLAVKLHQLQGSSPELFLYSANARHKSESLGRESNPVPTTHEATELPMRPIRDKYLL